MPPPTDEQLTSDSTDTGIAPEAGDARVVLILLSSQKFDDAQDRVSAVQRGCGLKMIVSVDAPDYGNAIKRDLARALDEGFTHAITFDLARHSIGDLPTLLNAIKDRPDAIITGVRPRRHGGTNTATRIGRAFCDFWTFGATRMWIHDSPYGFRAYPLAICADLVLRSTSIEIDQELAIKSIWAKVEIVQVSLDAREHGSTDRLSFADALRFADNNLVLLTQRFLIPGPLRQTMFRKAFSYRSVPGQLWDFIRVGIAHHSANPTRFSAAVGVGVFFGIVPIWGLQMFIATVVAHMLRLSKAIVVASSNISFPAMIPFIFYFSLLIGHLVHTGEIKTLPRLRELTPGFVLQSLGEYVVGAVILAVVAGLLAFVLTYTSVTVIRIVGHRGIRQFRGVP